MISVGRILIGCAVVCLTLVAMSRRDGEGIEYAAGAHMPAANHCDSAALPTEVQTAMKRDFSGWKIQQSETLSNTAMSDWSTRKPAACAGLATGEFSGTRTVNYALLLVPAHAGEHGFMLVVYALESSSGTFKGMVIEKSKDADGASFFIRSASTAKFFDDASRKTFQVGARDAIEMIDAGESEYEADVYFWSNGRFRHEPMDE